MAVINPDVILISSDDEDDYGGRNFAMAAFNHEVFLISSDDDGGRNLDEGLESEPEGDYSESDDHEEDKEKQDDVEKLNHGECLANCDERGDRSGVFNQGGNDLHALSFYECKMYLRKHQMWVSGTKEECIQRIEEHERLKDGKGESFYPKSSFSINCTGDACRGDVVLFKQNMYNSQRNQIGRRTVAGRIVTESYGASSEHTFSVEVLWSKRCKKLDPLSILLVKGRNLYRFGTFRQPWRSEAERSEVLDEKHERGKAARLKRKLRETEFDSGGNKGKKIRKVSPRVASQSKHVNALHKHKYANENLTAHNETVLFQNVELGRSTQLTYHSDPNCSISGHHIQDASLPFSYNGTLQPNYLPPCSFSGHSHHNIEQGPNQVLSQPPDHDHHNAESPGNRSKDEKAKLHFPESSFSIDCKGDAREKDVVLFKQQVFLGGKNVEEKRTVAGRIVKVRQCESRDEHKFLIKVLWTIPFINNLRRSTLLVKSHNLYKFGTFRQPWENEAMRSKMFKEKHGPATRKRKLKTDIALNKNKGAKRQKISNNGPSSSKQPSQMAKHKSSKRKAASASPVKKTKTGPKKKHLQLQKTKVKKSKKQTFQLHPNPNMNLNSSLSSNPNLNPNSDPISSTTSNPNSSPHLNSDQHTNPKTRQNPSTHQNQNPNPNPNTHQNQHPNITNPNLNPTPNPISSTTSNPNPSPRKIPKNLKKNRNLKKRKNPNPKTHCNLKKCQNLHLNLTNPNSSPNSNPMSSTILNPDTPGPHLNPNQQRTNLNTHQNLNPHLNNYIPTYRQQESSLSLPYDTFFMPTQPPVWLPQNQSPFGFPVYGGQWEPNNFLIQSLAYNMTLQMLTAALWYQQPR